MSDGDIADRVRTRASETGADIVILPERFDDNRAKGVYAQDTLLLVKRLRQEGIKAEYLDASADRYFVTQKSALLVLASAIGVGVVSSAAWDGLKKLVSLVRSDRDENLTIKVTDASDTHPAEVSVTGSPAQVLDALEQLKARRLLPAETTAPVLGGAPPRGDSANEPSAPSAQSLRQIEAALTAGSDLLDRSRQILALEAADHIEAEELARQSWADRALLIPGDPSRRTRRPPAPRAGTSAPRRPTRSRRCAVSIVPVRVQGTPQTPGCKPEPHKHRAGRTRRLFDVRSSYPSGGRGLRAVGSS